MTAPRAVGVRLPYDGVPAAVRAWVEQTLGSPVVEVAELEHIGAHLAVRSVVAVDVNLPTLNEFRTRESGRMLEAVARRTGRAPAAGA